MKTKNLLTIVFCLFLVQYAYAQDPMNGDWTDQEVTLFNTPEAALMVRVGDIDNLGFGWPADFDPFSGASTPAHSYPFTPDPEDYEGTDRIMVITSYVGSPPSGQDGYTNYTTRPENLPREIVLDYDLGGTTVSSATLQIFVDDFQAPVFGANYFVTINNVQAPYIANQINTLIQTGPIGKLINVAIPPEHLYLVTSGTLSILFDDFTTGAGDGYAIDFVKLLINPTGYTYTGTITGTVTDYNTGNPVSGALISASGLVETSTAFDGSYTLENVAAGLVNVTASAAGYGKHSGFVDLEDGETVIYDIQLEEAIIPECDTLHYPLDGTPILFYSTEGGYVCGNNTYGDQAKADLFEPEEPGKQLHKGYFQFGYASHESGVNYEIIFHVWDDNGPGNLPGAPIANGYLALSQIVSDVNNNQISEVVFDPPVQIDGPFYLGVFLPTLAGDTVALLSTDDGEVDPGISYELWSDGTWYAFSDNSAWGINVAQAIYAAYCDEGFDLPEVNVDISMHIFPNPASETLHIQLDIDDALTISMINNLGQKCGEWSFSSARDIVLPLNTHSSGLYLVTVEGQDFKLSRKIVVE